jgi:hypothetical protein
MTVVNRWPLLAVFLALVVAAPLASALIAAGCGEADP